MWTDRYYHEVPAQELFEIGVLDVLKIDQDAMPATTIDFSRVHKLGFAAGYKNFEHFEHLRNFPSHSIAVYGGLNAPGANRIGYGVEELEDGTMCVLRPTPGRGEPRARFTPEQSEVLHSLVEQSVALGIEYED